MMGLSEGGRISSFNNMFNRLDKIPRLTDGQTDGIAISISLVAVMNERGRAIDIMSTYCRVCNIRRGNTQHVESTSMSRSLALRQ